MTTTTSEPVSITSLTNAIEARDAEALLAWYATDATITVVDRDHPPASPSVYQGIDAIGEYYRDVCGRNIDHEVRNAVATSDGLAFAQHCRYPDGTAVLCVTVARTRDGKIYSQTGAQVWDG